MDSGTGMYKQNLRYKNFANNFEYRYRYIAGTVYCTLYNVQPAWFVL
jgi:hypothetical protein